MSTLASLSKEDPLAYFADPVDPDLVPGYRDVVSECVSVRAGGAEKPSTSSHLNQFARHVLTKDVEFVVYSALMVNGQMHGQTSSVIGHYFAFDNC